jgi:hypothetical protein
VPQQLPVVQLLERLEPEIASPGSLLRSLHTFGDCAQFWEKLASFLKTDLVICNQHKWMLFE